MTERTGRSSDRASINLSVGVRDALNERLDALSAVEGRFATQDQLIGALLAGVPLWQADLMLRTYIKQQSQTLGREVSDE